MSAPSPPPSPGPLVSLPKWLQWTVLVAVSLVLVVTFEAIDIPAALLIGAMIAAIAMGISGATIRAPGMAFDGAQMVMEA